MVGQPKLYSYVVEHDTGHAPNPYFGVCTLCRCKFRKNRKKPKNVVELAREEFETGSTVWIVGTGGANARRSAGHGKIVYAMRVDETLTRGEYYADRRFAAKKCLTTGTYKRTKGDNLRPTDDFETRDQFALISRHFYYFGANAILIPRKFPGLEKKGPGFKKRFDSAYISSFVKWLEKSRKPRKYGDPCESKPEGSRRCKSSC
jgi:hypothetical protein